MFDITTLRIESKLSSIISSLQYLSSLLVSHFLVVKLFIDNRLANNILSLRIEKRSCFDDLDSFLSHIAKVNSIKNQSNFDIFFVMTWNILIRQHDTIDD